MNEVTIKVSKPKYLGEAEVVTVEVSKPASMSDVTALQWGYIQTTRDLASAVRVGNFKAISQYSYALSGIAGALARKFQDAEAGSAEKSSNEQLLSAILDTVGKAKDPL